MNIEQTGTQMFQHRAIQTTYNRSLRGCNTQTLGEDATEVGCARPVPQKHSVGILLKFFVAIWFTLAFDLEYLCIDTHTYFSKIRRISCNGVHLQYSLDPSIESLSRKVNRNIYSELALNELSINELICILGVSEADAWPTGEIFDGFSCNSAYQSSIHGWSTSWKEIFPPEYCPILGAGPGTHHVVALIVEFTSLILEDREQFHRGTHYKMWKFCAHFTSE